MMKSAIFHFISLSVAAIVVIFCGSVFVKTAITRDNSCLDIVIESSKDKYLPYEPVIIRYKIHNISNNILMTNNSLFKECFHIIDDDGVEHRNTQLISVIMGDSIAAGATLIDSEYIQLRYNVISPNSYTCRMQVYSDIVNPPCLHDIESNEIKIIIDAPKGINRLAYDKYNDAIMLRNDKTISKASLLKDQFESYLRIADSFPGSIYAPIALHSAIVLTSVPDNRDILISIGKRLIEDYPGFEPYSAWAYLDIINILKEERRLDEAAKYMNYLIDKYPGSVMEERAKYWLGRIQRNEIY